MADETDNLVLALLREMRGDVGSLRGEMQEMSLRLRGVERKMDDLQETVATSVGWSAHAVTVTEKSGERFDELTDQIAALGRRVSALETKS